MTPYSFGYAVGARLEKRADVPMQMGGMAPERTWGQAIGEGVFGTAPTLGLGQLDPTQRGLAQDIALYSNPFTGVATGANDMARHLYNGRYGSALGAAGMTALSFLPGFGAAAGKAIGRGLVNTGARIAGQGAGNIAAQATARGAIGNALVRGGNAANRFVTQGANIAQDLNNAASRGIQRVLPAAQTGAQKTWSNLPGRAYNAGLVKNPAMGATIVGPMVLPNGGTTDINTPAVGAAYAGGNAMMPPPPARPQFRPMPMVR